MCNIDTDIFLSCLVIRRQNAYGSRLVQAIAIEDCKICITFVVPMRMSRHILFIVIVLMSIAAWGQDVPVDTVVATDSTAQMNRFQRIKEHVKELVKDRIEEKMNEPYDTVRDGTYWWRAMKHGKVDLTGKTIHYPKFLRFAWRVYKWGDKTFNSYDTSYVVSTGKNWKLIYKSNIWSDNYRGEPSVENMHVDMRSKLAANMGLQLSFMAVSVGYTLGITNLINGEKVSNKVDFSFTCARFAAEAYYMENRGTVTVRVRRRTDGEKWNATLREFGGFHRKAYGMRAYYFFNNRRYAQAAAYCFSKYQKRSAGSFIAGICLQHRDMGINMEEFPPFVLDQIPPGQEMPHFLYNDYCLMAGYGYNWVLGTKWLLNLTVAPYVGYRHLLATQNVDRASAWSVNMRVRMGAIYNHKKYFVGLQNYGDFHRYKSEKNYFIGSLLDFTALVGIRF